MDLNLLERTNPVFNTAKMTLFQMAYAGNEDAAKIAQLIGLQPEKELAEYDPEELLNNTIVLETRFRTMGALAMQSGCGTAVDLPCGYTPRAIEFAGKGLRFVGLDLPAAIAQAGPAITSLIDRDRQHLVRFEGVDATNYPSLKAVFDEIPGDVCITTEGLLMYFSDSETGQLCDNIRQILLSHGGCWITADPETTIQYMLTARAFYGDRFMEVVQKGKNRVQNKSDVSINTRTLIVNPMNAKEGIENAMRFLASHGLRAERVIVGQHAPELEILKRTTAEKAETIRNAMMQYAYWKITPIAGKQLDTTGTAGESFSMKAEIAGETMTIQLQGRLDTLTAPGLLSFYEKTAAEHPISEVVIDCTKLDYISSAGLRIFLIMRKASKNGVRVRGVNAAVREIMEQTGFDSILYLEE